MSKDKKDKTIKECCYNGSLEMAKWAITKGYDLQNDPDGILHLSVENEQEDTIKYLIEKGININIKDNRGNNVLHLMMKRYYNYGVNRNILSLLLDKGIDINAKNNDGNTPLCIFCETDEFGYREVVEFLLSRGASPFIKNNQGFAPLYYLVINVEIKILETIKFDQTNVNIQYNEGNTLLHIACLEGNWDVADFLIKKGIDKYLLNKEDRSAHYLAIEYLKSLILIEEYSDRYVTNEEIKDHEQYYHVERIFPPSGGKTKVAS